MMVRTTRPADDPRLTKSTAPTSRHSTPLISLPADQLPTQAPDRIRAATTSASAHDAFAVIGSSSSPLSFSFGAGVPLS